MITETDISVQVLPSVTKVLLGCDGVMANGCVLATVGTSQVIIQLNKLMNDLLILSPTGCFVGQELQQAGDVLQ